MTLLGRNSDFFDLPVCDKFIPTLHNGQMCYQLKLNTFKDEINIENGLDKGLTFVMDYNEEKMMNEKYQDGTKRDIIGLNQMKYGAGGKSEATIFLGTLGISFNLVTSRLSLPWFCHWS